MSSQNIIIGIDHGNGQIKTAAAQFSANLVRVTEPVQGSAEPCMKYEGGLFQPSSTRGPVRLDKTESEDCWRATLYAVGRECLERGLRGNVEADLACGLPAAWMDTQGRAFREYLRRPGPHSFLVGDAPFNLQIGNVYVCPQGYAGASRYLAEYQEEAEVDVIDVGSWTLDALTTVDGAVDQDSVCSLELGAITCYHSVARALARSGVQLREAQVENALRGTQGRMPPETAQMLEEGARRWCERAARQLREYGFLRPERPCIFLGGGARLFRKYFHDGREALYPNVRFVDDLRANARGYERIAQAKSQTA